MARPKTPPAKAAPRKLALPKSALPRKTVRRAGFALRYATIAAIWAAALGSLVLLWFTWDLPNPASAITQPRRPAIVLLDPAGQLVARFGDIAGKVELPAQLPPYVAAAFIAIEDKRFETHGAFDAFGMLRAGISDLAHRQIVQGGSTLTQQTAKTLFLTNQRSLRRKVQEAILSLWLWRHYSRAEILGIYLNRVYLGAGAYGVDAAAKLYFGVPATKLTLAEAAILAGLPKAPSSLNPLANPQAAQNRALQVLGAMLANGAITQDQETAAEAELADAASPSSHSSWFALWTMQQAGALIPEGVDATLATTMNASLQTAAESALNTAISAEGDTLNMHQGAVVVLDAKTGAVRALVGGVGDREGYNRAVLARRQTGSAIKPVVWLAGLQAGMTPDDTVLDAPLSLAGYHPKDYERSYRGEVSMREALADSMNTAAIRILLRAGGARRGAVGAGEPAALVPHGDRGGGAGDRQVAERLIGHALRRRAGLMVKTMIRRRPCTDAAGRKEAGAGGDLFAAAGAEHRAAIGTPGHDVAGEVPDIDRAAGGTERRPGVLGCNGRGAGRGAHPLGRERCRWLCTAS
ncbi:MAG: hypothetical protein B7Y73_08660, partial [Acidocella sp. 35-58-6]